MTYRGYQVVADKMTVLVKSIKDFNLVHTFECGQCFRWEREEDGSYTGVAFERVINVKIEDDKLIISNTTMEDFQNIWFNYFDLARDYGSIKNKLANNPIMKKAIEFGSGIRILNQDIWEAIISFILSTNNNIPRIKKNINELAMSIGKRLSYNGKDYYTFPTAQQLSNSDMSQINLCKAGYRCPYLKSTANMIKEGNVELDILDSMDTKTAIKELCRLTGVGEKVASCALLFSGIESDVFPVDVWIKKTVETVFLKKSATLTEINNFAENTFGALKGFAQQYLFYYMRERKGE